MVVVHSSGSVVLVLLVLCRRRRMSIVFEFDVFVFAFVVGNLLCTFTTVRYKRIRLPFCCTVKVFLKNHYDGWNKYNHHCYIFHRPKFVILAFFFFFTSSIYHDLQGENNSGCVEWGGWNNEWVGWRGDVGGRWSSLQFLSQLSLITKLTNEVNQVVYQCSWPLFN